jgi:hypothetical protein
MFSFEGEHILTKPKGGDLCPCIEVEQCTCHCDLHLYRKQRASRSIDADGLLYISRSLGKLTAARHRWIFELGFLPDIYCTYRRNAAPHNGGGGALNNEFGDGNANRRIDYRDWSH